jgi:hypothetical protein
MYQTRVAGVNHVEKVHGGAKVVQFPEVQCGDASL